jgi:magnesium-transporting ATPase (P-type)
MALMTADAYVENTDDATKEWSIRGRPVERALVQAALETGLHQDSILQEYPRLDFLPFDSRRRFVASLHSFGSPRSKTRRVFLAGAPELFLTHSNSVFSEGKSIRLLKEVRRNFEAVQKAESASGMRIIAVGYTDLKINKFSDLGPETAITESVLSKPVLSGLVVLHDPIREDVPEAISTAHQAGTHVIMLTGDNPITALKIAQEAGIAGENDSALTGTDIDRLDDQELALALKRRKVFSRVLPQQKLRIARLLKSRGEVVAMTGDGVNDAPALRSADIGIALGSGTEVAKEASDLILLNNSFSIIVRAIEEGRRIRDNLKKIVTYLLSTSFTELFVVSAAIVAGTALPILPTQILWIKIIEETFMNFSFAFEPAEKDVMQRDPRTRAMREILTPDVQKLIAIVVLSTGVLLVGLYFTLLNIGMPIEKIRTYMFIALSVDSIFFTFSLKNLHAPIWKISLFNNRYLLLAFIGSFVSLIMALEIPALVSLLSLADSNFMDYLYILGLGLANLIIIETAKWFAFPNQANKS